MLPISLAVCSQAFNDGATRDYTVDPCARADIFWMSKSASQECAAAAKMILTETCFALYIQILTEHMSHIVMFSIKESDLHGVTIEFPEKCINAGVLNESRPGGQKSTQLSEGLRKAFVEERSQNVQMTNFVPIPNPSSKQHAHTQIFLREIIHNNKNNTDSTQQATTSKP